MKVKEIPHFLELLGECGGPTEKQEKELKTYLPRILRGNDKIVSDDFDISIEGIYLYIFVRGEYRIEDIENFCQIHKLPFFAHSQRVIYDGGEENSDYSRLEWEPGMDYVKRIHTGIDFSETVSKEELDQLTKAARDCKDFKKLPTKLNSTHSETKEFARRCLAGEDLVSLLLEGIEGLFQKQIVVPEFKLEKVKRK